MKDSKFTLFVDGKQFKFEINMDGYVYLVEKTKKISTDERTNIGQTRPVTTLTEAKEIGMIMLFISGRINKIER